MLGQQLQHPHVLPNARARTVPFFQPLTKFAEDLRQLPIAIHVRMIQSRRTPLQCGQIVQRIKHIVTGVITAKMGRDHRIVEYDLDMIDIALDRHRLKRRVTRHAVVHVVEPRELVLIDLRRLPDAGIEPLLGQRGRPLFFFRKAFADRLRLAAAFAVQVLQAALAQIRIEFLHVLDFGHRRGPFSFQGLDAVFHHRLFIAPRRHAEQWLKHVMTRQRLIPRIELPRPTRQEHLGHRFRIVPPDFLGHTTEKLKRLTHALQDGLGPLRRQSHRKGRIGIRPH
jgi:hypothetical protein